MTVILGFGSSEAVDSLNAAEVVARMDSPVFGAFLHESDESSRRE